MKRCLRALSAALLLLLIAVSPAQASGPGQGGRRIRLDQARAGPFRLRVITSPTPPVVEQLYLEVRVTSAETDELVLDAQVTTFAIPLESTGARIEALATHDFAPIPTDYAAHLPVDAAGPWEIQIHVLGPQGEGWATFTERVTSGDALGPALSVAIPIAALGALAVIFAWLQRSASEQDG